MKKPSSSRISQMLFLALFLVLFLMTEYRGSDEISAAVNAFFRANPLTSVSTMLATKRFELLLLPGLVVLLFTAFLGRFFCGWICPLGTVLDLVTGKIRKVGAIRQLQGNVKYWLLLPLLFASLFNLNISGILDPIAILLRGLTFFFHPVVGETVRGGWKGLYGLVGDRRDLLDPAYAVVRDYLLPFRETLYPLAFLSALLFFLIIFLERYERRNWCRNLCPLGTLLGLAARYSPFTRLPAGKCYCCRGCTEGCPGGFSRDIFQAERCLRCMHCSIVCSSGRARFTASRQEPRPPVMERRVFLGGIAGGFFAAKLFRFRSPEAQATLLRPPGVREEREFLEKCVRCGECMKVCLRSALYPALFQAGAEGIYTPVMIPRLGYCEYNCTLCGQVCPTGAIPNLAVETKKLEVIGKAVLDKNRCIPFVHRTDCLVCEEHCPIPQKAIRTEAVEEKDFAGNMVTVRKPYIVEELCNGCGICENVCPLEGKAGVYVNGVKDRSPLRAVPALASAPSRDESNPYGL